MNKERFATVSEDEIKKLKVESHAINTRKATESAMRTIFAHLEEKKIQMNTESVTKDNFNTILERFFLRQLVKKMKRKKIWASKLQSWNLSFL